MMSFLFLNLGKKIKKKISERGGGENKKGIIYNPSFVSIFEE